MQHNVLAMSGRAVEAAGDVHTLLLDKTGTITLGNRQAAEFIPLPGVSEAALADAAQLSSLADETPEGRSIVVLAKEKYGLRGRELAPQHATFVPFTAQTRMSGVDLQRPRSIRKGAADADVGVRKGAASRSSEVVPAADRPSRLPDRPAHRPRRAARRSSSPTDAQALGVIHLKDIVKGGIRERFAAAARDGHQDGDDHRRQPADRRGDRRRGRRRRLPRRGDAGRQDGADQAASRPTASSWR